MVTGHVDPVAHDRRHRRSLEIRERLFRSALDLFAQQGFSDTTVEDITNAADLGKGTFFNYFPSKDHLLLAFADMQLTKLQSSLSTYAPLASLSPVSSHPRDAHDRRTGP